MKKNNYRDTLVLDGTAMMKNVMAYTLDESAKKPWTISEELIRIKFDI